MSKRVLLLLSLIVLLGSFFERSSLADPSPLDQSQVSQSQFSQPQSRYNRSHQLIQLPSRGRVFSVYLESKSLANHYFPTGLMGDYSDIVFNDASKESPHSGKTCIKIIYKNDVSKGARWAGMSWQNPAYNWGNKEGGGFNLLGFSKLVFWARGNEGGERIEAFRVGGAQGTAPDSSQAKIGPVTLTEEWKKYEIDLPEGNLSSISNGFSWVATIDKNPAGAVFYLDDIYFI